MDSAHPPIRVLIAKVGLDGHDRGVKIVARTLRDAGMDVIYTGLHRTPQEVVEAAIQEDVDAIGISILSGAHMTVFPRVLALLAERGADDILVVGGGVIPDEDVAALMALGVKAILLQDTPPDTIVAAVRRVVAERRDERAGVQRELLPLGGSASAASDPPGGRMTLAGSMESWTFPPRYDADYRPPSASRYWFPVRETMPAGERDRAILGRLQALTRYAWEHAPFYRRKWDEAGFHPDHLRTLEDFEAKVPVITKHDLRDAQAREPPFGDYLCVPGDEVHHIHGTSGTTGRPDELRHRARRLGRDRQRARANSLGHGPAARRHRVHRGDLQPLHGLVGHAGRRRAPPARRRFRSAPARPG